MAWIKANALAAMVSAVASLLVFALRHGLGTTDPQAGIGIWVGFVVAAGVLSGLAGATWGLLTGAVLQRKIPRLPARAWIVLHAALAAGLFVGTELLGLAPIDGAAEPIPAQDTIALGLVLGATAGAVTGAIEALLLGQAARGLGAWVAWSALAYAVFVLMVVAVEGPRAEAQAFAEELVNQGTEFVASVLMSLVMLPALRRLQPL
jgi:hypothetical protein